MFLRYSIFDKIEKKIINNLNDNEKSFLYYTLKQAKLSFKSSRKIDLYISPIVLFYGLVSLAKITIFFKTKEVPHEVLHGLTVRVAGEKSINWSENYDPGSETILVKEKGLFPLFFKSISPYQVPEGEKFTLRELFEFLNKDTSLPPLAIHYLILFLLSMLSRYEPQKWGWTLEKSEYSKKIVNYLKNVDKEILHLWSESIKL